MRNSLLTHAGMIGDERRLAAISRALEQGVRPGDRVADLGSGSGVLALLALRCGAAHVYAVESEPIIELARELARDNGAESRITFLECSIEEAEIPEPVDLLVSDLRGTLPLHRRHPLVVAEAARRHLAPGGRLIPRRDVIRLALCRRSPPLSEAATPAALAGIELKPLRQALANSWWGEPLAAEQLVGAPRTWAVLEYPYAESQVRGSVSWTVDEPVRADGFAAWFDSELAPGVSFSSHPGAGPTCYCQGFFPWPQALTLGPGETLDVTLEAHLVEVDWIWTWSTRLRWRHGGEERFQQTTFRGESVSAGQLQNWRRGTPA